MDKKPLQVSSKMKIPGLTVFCKKCRQNVSVSCKETKTPKPILRCEYGHRHEFKIYVQERNSSNRKTKMLGRNLHEAVKEGLIFIEAIKNGHPQEPKPERKEVMRVDEKPLNVQKSDKPELLINAIARYVAILAGENVPKQFRKVRSKNHRADVKRILQHLLICLKKNGHDVLNFRVQDLNDHVVGQWYEYLEEQGFGNRNFNKYFSCAGTFLEAYIEEHDVQMKNYFRRVEQKKLNYTPQSITAEEYSALLEQITPENGTRTYDKGVKPVRNVFRPWLRHGIRLALETGTRREELINIKFSDIIEDKDGLPACIKVENLKVNRIENRTDEENKKFVYVPVTESLYAVLLELGYTQCKGQDMYILAPNIQSNRKREMADVLSRGFSHYFDQVSERKLSFKCLRKTYFTSYAIYGGEQSVKEISGHSNNKTIQTHYLDDKVIANARRSFSIFSKTPKRQDELQHIRDNHQHSNIIEK